MATGTGNLPNQNMDFVPLATLPAADLDKLVDNIEALATGSGIGDGSISTAALADGAITNAKLDTTAGEPGGAWTTWTPTYGASGSLTYTSVTTGYAKYLQIGKTIFFNLYATGTTGGTASNSITFTLPVAAANLYNVFSGGVLPGSGVTVGGFAFTDNSATVVFVRKYDSSNYALGGAAIRVSGTYEAA